MDKVKEWANNVNQFLTGAKVELKKVTWPAPKQAFASTSVVVIVVIVMSIFLGIVDFGVAKMINFIFGY